ncbi:hypothetical protein HR45_01555 [Shewanella mangrovi]|uniref:Lipoprotein n=1 Tax=Shewanella mangrovi TaxID=1515746 RepID=A0A094JIS6_9GAMM|nr:hypothetical protein [Shewanella mangrovi]KFZ39112.1 hypothetical protein HR45_01555 [Shewanella mangrovi]
MNKRYIAVAIGLMSVYGCASSGDGLRELSYEEASTFERALLSLPTSQKPAEFVYTQPVNKTEPCKLPSSKAQQKRPHFRAYWDGECKNGFAYGLGRDISISDTHHLEEITFHNGTGDNRLQPKVLYDFVNKFVLYSVGGEKWPASSYIRESYRDGYDGFIVVQTMTAVDEKGQVSVLEMSPFNTTRFYYATNVDNSIIYAVTDNTATPVINPNAPVYTLEIMEPNSKTRGGVAVAGFSNGLVRQYRIENGQNVELVKLPVEYTNHLNTIYQKVRTDLGQVTQHLQSAQQIEREYLYKACNGNSAIKGLKQREYTKVCTWRDQFKKPYAEASLRFQQRLKNMQAQAANVEQQRLIQQQIAMQQQIVQQQQNQQIWNQINQTSQQLQQNNQRMLQSINSWQAPQVQPIATPSRNIAVCHTVGSIVMCN